MKKKEELTIRLIKPSCPLRDVTPPAGRLCRPEKEACEAGRDMNIGSWSGESYSRIQRLILRSLKNCLSLGLILLLPFSFQPPVHGQLLTTKAEESKKNDPSFQKLADRLSLPDEPVSREGTGILIVQAPGKDTVCSFA